MNYKIVESGSSGNATIVEGVILIDCGVSFKKLQPYYEDLKLVLLTHIHSDHFNKATIKKLASVRPTLRFGCCAWLVEELIKCGVNKRNIDLYTPFEGLHYGLGLAIESFELKHDVSNCGWRIMFDDGYKYFYATDTCSLNNIEAKDYDMYFIEGNYEDETELKKRKQKHIENGEFYYEDRIEKTHLSQVQALDWLNNNMGENSQYIFMHQHIEKESRKEVTE
ncbi:MAG: MBL fold metallo-hydrolase [Bacilli bacterium]|jgi:phosphoribosyl 1,2-cyclic phosphodiesterase|nr:MBL fold metallo-hydrolase [Bacilli bacterium]